MLLQTELLLTSLDFTTENKISLRMNIIFTLYCYWYLPPPQPLRLFQWTCFRLFFSCNLILWWQNSFSILYWIRCPHSIGLHRLSETRSEVFTSMSIVWCPAINSLHLSYYPLSFKKLKKSNLCSLTHTNFFTALLRIYLFLVVFFCDW